MLLHYLFDPLGCDSRSVAAKLFFSDDHPVFSILKDEKHTTGLRVAVAKGVFALQCGERCVIPTHGLLIILDLVPTANQRILSNRRSTSKNSEDTNFGMVTNELQRVRNDKYASIFCTSMIHSPSFPTSKLLLELQAHDRN